MDCLINAFFKGHKAFSVICLNQKRFLPLRDQTLLLKYTIIKWTIKDRKENHAAEKTLPRFKGNEADGILIIILVIRTPYRY